MSLLDSYGRKASTLGRDQEARIKNKNKRRSYQGIDRTRSSGHIHCVLTTSTTIKNITLGDKGIVASGNVCY